MMLFPRKVVIYLAATVAAAVALVSGHPAAAQIELRSSYKVHEPIEITVSGSPSVILWRTPAGVATISQDNGKRLFVWAGPGRYVLSVTCLTVDWDAKSIDAKEHSATLVIEGTGPVPPDPIVPPPVVVPPVAGIRSIFLIHETADTSPNLARLVAQLRVGEPAKYLASKQHNLRILDDEQIPSVKESSPVYSQWLAKVDGKPLPCLLIADTLRQDSSGVLFVGELPSTPEAVLELIKRHGG